MTALGLRLSAAVALLLVGGGLLGEQVWLAAKARVAHVLIDRAFADYLVDGRPHRPWSWADTWPVARLEVPGLGIERIVLAGASGSSLAFGPGHVDGTCHPNERGNCAIAGHRDGSFAFLRELGPGDRLSVRTPDGIRHWRVERAAVVSMWDVELLEPTDDDRLTLITCYPFEGLTSSPWRYVVHSRPDGAWLGTRGGREPARAAGVAARGPRS